MADGEQKPKNSKQKLENVQWKSPVGGGEDVWEGAEKEMAKFRKSLPIVAAVQSVEQLQEALAGNGRIGRYQIGKKLASGAFGHVYLARRASSHKIIALKEAFIKHTSPHMIASVKGEICCMAELPPHPNVVRLFNAFYFGPHSMTGTPRVGLELEWINGDDLQVVGQNYTFTAAQTWSVISQTTCALRHLHKHGIIHCDLKQENLLLERGTGRTVLCDFGAAQRVGKANRYFLGGTMFCMSPERVGNQDISVKEDVWALGILAYELCTNAFYFDSGLPEQELLTKLDRFRLYRACKEASSLCNEFCKHTIAPSHKRWTANECAMFLEAVGLWDPEPDKDLWTWSSCSSPTCTTG